jgi:Ca2+/Na+ antiporter
MDAHGEKSLALFPAKFQKSMWIKRGLSYLSTNSTFIVLIEKPFNRVIIYLLFLNNNKNCFTCSITCLSLWTNDFLLSLMILLVVLCVCLCILIISHVCSIMECVVTLGRKTPIFFGADYDFVVMELFKSWVNSTPQIHFVKQSIFHRHQTWNIVWALGEFTADLCFV